MVSVTFSSSYSCWDKKVGEKLLQTDWSVEKHATNAREEKTKSPSGTINSIKLDTHQ